MKGAISIQVAVNWVRVESDEESVVKILRNEL
jgi:hypothetical protein